MKNELFLKIKQQAIAIDLGVTQQAVSSWISGRCQPKIQYIPKIAEILDCSVEDLVNALIDAQKNNKERREA